MRWHSGLKIGLSCVLAAGGLLAGCVPSAPAPTPAPSASPTPRPAQTPPRSNAGPAPSNWIDAPQTPGDWTYFRDPSETFASFGTSQNNATLLIRCDLRSRKVGIARAGQAAGAVRMRIFTETASREFEARAVGTAQPMLAAELAANDPLLDAIALSRGRFAVEMSGAQTVYIPAYPEITRVIEDCRAGPL